MDEKKIKATKRFWMLLKPDQQEIRNVYIYAIFSGLIGLSLPVGIQSIINLIQGAQISTSWFVLIIFVILGIFINGILQIRQLTITENLQQKIFARAAFEFAYRTPRFKLNALISKTAPELMNRFFDVMSIQKGLSKVIIDFSTAGIQTIFGLVLLSIYHPFFIVFSLFLLLLVFLVFSLTGKTGFSTSVEESNHKYAIAHWLQEIGRSKVAFKMSGSNNLIMPELNAKVEKYTSARENHFLVLVRQFKFLIGFKIIVAAGLLFIGSWLVMDQQMNIGQFVAAEIIILLVISSVEKMILSLEVIYDILTSLEKVGYVSDFPMDEEVNDKFDFDSTGPVSIRFVNVSFHHLGQEKSVFSMLNTEIKSNEKIWVTGANCSGKKTLLLLLSGLYKVSSGTITLNEVPICNYNSEKLRESIGLLTAEDCIFKGSLFDNIQLGRTNISMDKVKWVIELVGLSKYIDELPKGFYQEISSGVGLSESVKTKLLLARTLVNRPSLILIQDRLSSLDETDRNRIMNYLFSKECKATVVFTSNNKEFTHLADASYEILNNQLITINS